MLVLDRSFINKAVIEFRIREKPMGQLGRSKDGYYPDLALNDAIELVQKISDVGGTISQTGLAKMIGIDPRGAGLHSRVYDLKFYGLVEGNGELRVSPLGLEIIHGNLSKAWEAFMNIPLYARMHERLKGKETPDRVVLNNVLYEITKADEPSISRRATRLNNNYLEALQYASGQTSGSLDKSPMLGGARILSQPPIMSLGVSTEMESDFYVRDKLRNVFIAIDDIDTLDLAITHLQNARKTFQEKKISAKKAPSQEEKAA